MKESLLTILRDKETKTAAFRLAANRLAELIAAEVAASITEEPTLVQTPFGQAKGAKIPHNVVLIAILRTGAILLPPFLRLFPEAKIGFFGIRRDEKTAQPHFYYENLPAITSDDWVVILDPMIATGGSALLALEKLSILDIHPSRIFFAGVIAAAEGLQKIKTKYPYLSVKIVAEDPSLNPQKFITPGLGDFGDRYFDT
jgi:uracil phosphoribosyltransferase